MRMQSMWQTHLGSRTLTRSSTLAALGMLALLAMMFCMPSTETAEVVDLSEARRNLKAVQATTAQAGSGITEAIKQGKSQEETADKKQFRRLQRRLDQESYVEFDKTYFRWLWWPFLLYLFWSMAHICDEYFVRTIAVISERFQIPDDVAGATLMALGCNGPELALNTISIFQPSDIGVGAVIGGEVFNVLVIIGTAILATPDNYMPLKMDKFSFYRDVTFYAYSVFLLYWALRDGFVDTFKSMVLLSGAAMYSTTVVFSGKLRIFVYAMLNKKHKAADGARNGIARRMSEFGASTSLSLRVSRIGASQSFGKDSLSSDLLDDDGPFERQESVDEIGHAFSLHENPYTQVQWETSRMSADPVQGSVVHVRVELRNRLMDRGHTGEERFMWLCGDNLVVSTGIGPDAMRNQNEENRADMVYDYDEHTAQHWHHGGLINAPVCLDYGESEGDEAPKRDDTLKNVQSKMPPVVESLDLEDAPWEIIPLADVLYCDPAKESILDHVKANHMFTLHVHQHNTNLGRLMTLEFTTKEEEVHDAWVDAICSSLRKQKRSVIDKVDDAPHKTVMAFVNDWINWLQFPVKSLAAATIPDMDNPHMQKWYPIAFTMSMVWLAIIAFLVVTICDGIHDDFGISTAVLGFTVAAAGTSFPNVFSGMVVSRQGKPSMAVANALGANVQNVFIALAIPWSIQCLFIERGGVFTLHVVGLQPAAIECGLTLLPVVFTFWWYGGTFPRWSGALFLVVYGIYVFVSLAQESTGCMYWPLQCN